MTTAAPELVLPVAVRPAGRRRGPAMLSHQLRYDLLVLSRNRQARFFTLGLPVLMLLLFATIFGKGSFTPPGTAHVSGTTYYVANQVAFGIVDAAFMALAISLVAQRESGVLKRRRSTPEPAWVLVASRGLTGAVSAVALAALLLAIGAGAFGVVVPWRTLPALVTAVCVATASMGCLGFAMTGVINKLDSAQPVVMAATMPLFFLSGVFIPWFLVPTWLQHVAVVFPVRHVAAAVLTPFTARHGLGFAWGDLAVVALWGVAGLAVARRRFRWAPR
ncbi:MAG TPA: ABC transporter permease [Acidimicrobiales bacterium]|nr:ABC transporter permease [Acidimicrobiales bacterium]